MADDLKLSSNEYSIALVVFFVTYVAFEPGSNMILVRWKPSLYLPTIMAIWGCLTCTMAAINHFHHLVALRIFVGVFEAGFGKTSLNLARSLTANWYSSRYLAHHLIMVQARRAIQTIRCIYVGGHFVRMFWRSSCWCHHRWNGRHRWAARMAMVSCSCNQSIALMTNLHRLFIIEGVATIVWAFIASFILLDFPATSSRLTERERAIAVARLREGGVKSYSQGDERMGKGKSLRLAILDWRTIGFVLGYMVCTPETLCKVFTNRYNRLSSAPAPSATSIRLLSLG